MALLRVGQELIRHGEHHRIELTPDQARTGKPDRFDLPEIVGIDGSPGKASQAPPNRVNAMGLCCG
jgi:hypothetical protein